MHDDLLIVEVADNSLHMSTCGLHLSLQIEYHHNSTSCRGGRVKVSCKREISIMYFSRSQFSLLSAVLLRLFENFASVLPLYISVLLTLMRDWQYNEEQLRRIFNQNKAIARYSQIRQN